MKIKVGSRESRLAVIQSEMVMDAIRAWDPQAQVELVTMKTKGDRILDRNLDKIGGKGLFIKELEIALMDGRADLTVHSMKDMPMDIAEELPILAVSSREDPRDALILPEGATGIDLDKPIGCSSNRRMLQLSQMYPEARFAPIRGNVQTRLSKLDSGEFGATVLAVAGLKRAGLESRISRIFTPEEMLPAACQGILAVQGRRGYDVSCLEEFHDADVWRIALAERSFVRALDGGCTSPVAAFAVWKGNEARDEEATGPTGNREAARMTLTGLNIDGAGRPFTDQVEGTVSSDEEAEELGRKLAESMRR